MLHQESTTKPIKVWHEHWPPPWFFDVNKCVYYHSILRILLKIHVWSICLTPKPQNTPLLWSIASLSNLVTLQLVQHLALARHNVTATWQCGNRKWWVQALVFVDNWPICVLIITSITYLKQNVLLIFPWWLLVPSKWMFHKNLDFLAWYLRCRTPEVPWGLKFWWHWDHQWAYGIWAVHAWFWPSILAIDLLRRGCSLGQTLMLFLTLSTPRKKYGIFNKKMYIQTTQEHNRCQVLELQCTWWPAHPAVGFL